MGFELPEKDFFSIDEICDRWGCDHELLHHYIFEQRSLRLALKFKDFSWLTHNRLIYDFKFKEKFIIGFYTNPENKIEDFLYLHGINPVSPKGLVYLSAPLETFGESTEAFEDLEGQKFKLHLKLTPAHTATMLLSGVIPETVLRPFRLDLGNAPPSPLFNFPIKLSSLYITREERDRFEEKHTTTSEKVESDCSPLDSNEHWRDLKQRAEKAISKYPEWAEKYHDNKPQVARVVNWLDETITKNDKEKDVLKKILASQFDF